jgi:hypothetical protein
MGLGLSPSPPFAGIPAQAKVSTAPPASPTNGAAFDTRIDVSTRAVQHKGVFNGRRLSLLDINGGEYPFSSALFARLKRRDNVTLWWYDYSLNLYIPLFLQLLLLNGTVHGSPFLSFLFWNFRHSFNFDL